MDIRSFLYCLTNFCGLWFKCIFCSYNNILKHLLNQSHTDIQVPNIALRHLLRLKVTFHFLIGDTLIRLPRRDIVAHTAIYFA